MRLIPWSPAYEAHTPSCMNLIHRMRTKLIYDSYMSLIQNVCARQRRAEHAAGTERRQPRVAASHAPPRPRRRSLAHPALSTTLHEMFLDSKMRPHNDL